MRWIASGSYRSRPSAIACSVVAVPATATSVRASRIGTVASASSSDAIDRARHRPDLGRRRRIGRDVPFRQTDAPHLRRTSRARHGPAPARRRTRWNRHRCRAPGTADGAVDGSSPWVPPRNDSPASRSPLITSSSLPASSRTAAANSSRFAASRTALVAATRMRSACSARARRQKRASTSTVRRSASGSRRPVRSTPWPSRVMTMSRASSVGSPPASAGGSTTSSRIEFVPWSIAATRPSRSSAWIGSTCSATHAADRVDAARQVERVVGVQALHAPTRAADAAVLQRLGQVGGAVLRVRPMRGEQRLGERGIRALLLVEPGDRAGRLQARHRLARLGTRQPVRGRERRARGVARRVADHERMPSGAAHHDRERRGRLAPELLADGRQIGRAELAVGRSRDGAHRDAHLGRTGDGRMPRSCGRATYCRPHAPPTPTSRSFAPTGSSSAGSAPRTSRRSPRTGRTRTWLATRAGTRTRAQQAETFVAEMTSLASRHARRVVPVRGRRRRRAMSCSATRRSAWMPTTRRGPSSGSRSRLRIRGRDTRPRRCAPRSTTRSNGWASRSWSASPTRATLASIALLERIGMTHVSTAHVEFKGEWCDEHTYELRRGVR